MADTVFNSLLPLTVELWRPTKTSGSSLTQTIAYTLISNSVVCRLWPRTATIEMVNAGVIPEVDHKAYFKNTESIQENDILYVVSGGYAGTYVVRGVNKPSDGTEIHHISAFLKRRDYGNFSWSLDFSDPGNSILYPLILA